MVFVFFMNGCLILVLNLSQVKVILHSYFQLNNKITEKVNKAFHLSLARVPIMMEDTVWYLSFPVPAAFLLCVLQMCLNIKWDVQKLESVNTA